MEGKTKKICFVGAPSTGKTTLARLIAEELINKNHSVESVGEFARDYILEHGTIEGPEDQLSIARGQKEKEKIAKSRNPEFIVCDVPSFLSHVYFNFLKDTVFEEKKKRELGKIGREIWREIGSEINSYDFVFFLPPEFSPQEDGVRLYTDKIENISNRIQAFLSSHNIKHQELRGSVQERADRAFKIIDFGE